MSLLLIALFVLAPIALLAFLVKSSRRSADISRAGLMELQNLLEPERKVEIFREVDSKEELLVRLDHHSGE